MRVILKIWIPTSIIYISFFLWYTNLGGKLTSEEIDFFSKKMFENQLESSNMNEDTRTVFLDFMKNDTGNQFIMVNVIKLNDDPPNVKGANPGEDAVSLIGRYMEFMYPELLIRASHPIFAGSSVGKVMDKVGIEGLDNWDRAALMRYKSRRALMEIVINPEMTGRHDFKIAAIKHTLAYPVEVQLNPADPRGIFLLILVILGLIIQLRLKK